jgi:GAF domain-containing protein
VSDDRRARILGKLANAGAAEWSSARLCEVARDLVGVSGAGVMLMSGDVQRGSLCATNDVSDLIEELQYTLGEGPCVDAYNDNRVVLEPDLRQPRTTRWLAFTPPVVAAGVRALYAFPLHVGAVRLGALDLYRDRPGPLDADQHADAIVLAEVIASWVLDMQAQAPAGFVAEELERDADFHLVVHNAAGAVSVQLGVSIAEALIRLRAYAFSHDRSLPDVAEDVVARRLRF